MKIIRNKLVNTATAMWEVRQEVNEVSQTSVRARIQGPYCPNITVVVTSNI